MLYEEDFNPMDECEEETPMGLTEDDLIDAEYWRQAQQESPIDLYGPHWDDGHWWEE